MKTRLLGGVLIASLWGGAALAQTMGDQRSLQPLNDQSTQLQPTTPAPVDNDVNVDIRDDDDLRPVAANDKNAKKDDDKHGMRGIGVMVGGGLEGYTGALADQIRPGPSWGVTAAIKPSKVLGLELGYSGAVNELGNQGRGLSDTTYFRGYEGGVARGPDIVRNGGRALATLGLGAAPVQPYVMGGVGIDRYQVRGAGGGFSSDTAGSIPFGAGIRGHLFGLTADARVGTSLLFNNDFAENVSSRNVAGVSTINATRYQGLLSLGGSF